MSLSPRIASDSPTSRRWRRCAPLLLAVGLIALALVPGVITGDRPFEISLCSDQAAGPQACGQAGQAMLLEGNLIR